MNSLMQAGIIVNCQLKVEEKIYVLSKRRDLESCKSVSNAIFYIIFFIYLLYFL